MFRCVHGAHWFLYKLDIILVSFIFRIKIHKVIPQEQATLIKQ